ncbi:hypothetical protein BaRGS_00027889, partial [Batillaria attramentaria]
MSPIEHLTTHVPHRTPLGHHIRQRPHTPANRHDLVRALQEEWRRIPRDLIRRLRFSMKRRVLA